MPASINVAVFHDVAAAALSHRAGLEEEAAIGPRVVRVLAVEKWQRAARVIHVPDDRVLVDASAAAIWSDLVLHDVTEVVVAVDACATRNFHDLRVDTAKERNAQRAAGSKQRQVRRAATRSVQIQQVFPNRRREVAEVEVPLPGDQACWRSCRYRLAVGCSQSS